MTKTYMSEEEIDVLKRRVISNLCGDGPNYPGEKTLDTICAQAKLASSAIAEAKALRALIDKVLEMKPENTTPHMPSNAWVDPVSQGKNWKLKEIQAILKEGE